MKKRPMLKKRFFRIRTWSLGIAFLAPGLKIACLFAYAPDGALLLKNREREDILRRRAYLIHEVEKPGFGPASMPSYLPPQFKGEWAIMTAMFTSAALTNIATFYPETRAEAREITGRLIKKVLRPDFREFHRKRWGRDPLQGLNAPRGHLAYPAYLNFILAAHYYLGGREYEQLFSRISLALERKYRNVSFYNLASYPGEIYVPDNSVALAGISLFYRLRGRKSELAERWIAYADKHLRDPRTGLLAFELSSQGKPRQGGRGSGSSYNVFFLSYVDSRFAKAQFRLLKKHHLGRAFFFSGIREHPHGRSGGGDIDSGPLCFGLSLAATGFAVAGARLIEDAELLEKFLFTGETAGFTWQWAGRRRYLTAPLVGEAVLLAAKTLVRWENHGKRIRFLQNENPQEPLRDQNK